MSAVQLSLQIVGDLLAVEASILDEDLVGAGARHDHSRNIDPVYITFQRDRIAHRSALLLR